METYVIDNRSGPIDFECNGDRTQRILQNVKNLLRCRMGEVPYDRLRGIDPALFDLPINEVNVQLMPEIDRVLGWEPNASAVSAAASQDENGDTIITVVIGVNQEGRSRNGQ